MTSAPLERIIARLMDASTYARQSGELNSKAHADLARVCAETAAVELLRELGLAAELVEQVDRELNRIGAEGRTA